jgi:MFS family permease
MLIANLLLAVGLLPMLLVHDRGSVWILYPALFFAAAIDQFVQPAQNALIPLLVSEEQLVTANSLNSISSNVSRLVGAALGGIMFAVLGLHSTILLDLISFLFVVVMLRLIKISAKAQPRPEAAAILPVQPAPPSLLDAWQRLGGEWLEGMHLIFRQPPLVVLFVIWMVTSFGEGIFGVLLVVFVKQVLNSGAVVYGLLLSVQAIGGLLGGLLLAQFGKRLAPARLIWFGLCLFGLIDLLIIDLPLFIQNIWLVGALFILVGIPGVGSLVGIQTLFQRIVEDRFRGRVFGMFLALGSLMTLIGMILAGALGDRLGSVLLLNIQGSGYLLSGILALLAQSLLLTKKAGAKSLCKMKENQSA